MARFQSRVAVLTLLVGLAAPVRAQDTIPAPADTLAADSAERALREEIRRLLGDSADVPVPDRPLPVPAGSPSAQSLNPDISAIGELLTDLSPEEPRWTESGSRFEVREVELGIQAVVDPFFRADFFIGLHPEAVEIEEAYLTALALPRGWQARLGKFHLPFGKVNLTHRPELITVDYPFVIQEYFGEEGFGSTGLGASKVVDWLGFFQELQLYVVSGIQRDEHAHGEEDEHAHEEEGEDHEDEVVVPFEGERSLLEELALMAHLRNYWDLSDASNVEFGLSAATGSVLHDEPGVRICPILEPCFVQIEESLETQRFYGADLTFRWRPLGRGLYRSLVWNNEVVLSDGPDGERRWGGFTQAQWQLGRRTYLGGRFDAVQPLGDPHEEEEEHEPGEEHEDEQHEAEEHDAEWLNAGSAYVTFLPSEFSRFKLAVQRTFGEAAGGEDHEGGAWRLVLQTTFAIGPHRPHGF